MFDEKKLRSIQRVSQVIAALSIVAFFALIAYSAYKLYSINRQTAEAAEKLNAVKAEEAKLAAEVKSKQNTIAALDDKIKALNNIYGRIANADPELVRQATKEAIDASPNAAQALPRIYIHIKDQTQRPRARQIANKLQASGFIVPGIEIVGERAPRSTQLRYFREGDDESADVKTILGLLRSENVKVDSDFNQRYAVANKIRPRHYELWFGDDFRSPEAAIAR
jgi:Tfp pilus assembly protein PilE